MKQNVFPEVDKAKLQFARSDERIFDKRLETKPIGYFKDAWIRFRRNASSVTAAVIIILLMLFAIIVPFCTEYDVNFRDPYYACVLPRSKTLSKLGFWDGSKKMTVQSSGVDYYGALGLECGAPAMREILSEPENGSGSYTIRFDTYNNVGFAFLNLSKAEYEALQAYQNSTGRQVLYPVPATHKTNYVMGRGGANFWYKLADESSTSNGAALRDEKGDYIPNYLTSENKGKAGYDSLLIKGDDGGADGQSWYVYAVKNQTGYKVRVDYHEYFIYQKGFEPNFLFGTNNYGQDILTCLAIGARLSFILAICVSAINLTIGAIYGAVEGYYGGAVDIILERVSDILASVPFIVVATLFQLHLAHKVGVLPSLLFAFVLTGWVGMASTVRMQFYRFKRQEYILAARTLGAKDWRLMFKHIFPNAIGTIITSSVLSIPGVIFSESMLSYLGIVSFETSSLTSIGSMLANGQGYLYTYPHIILFPAVFIALLEISFNLFGNGLRDAFNPALRGSEG